MANNNFLAVQTTTGEDEGRVTRNEYADPPKIGGRAVTANNHKYRPPVLQDTALNSSHGFGMSSGEEFANVTSE